MGSWSVYCGISNIAITSGNECVILPLKKSSGESYLDYIPATLPIFGEYNDYGGMENIVSDENTKLIEEHFGVTIDEFVELLVDGSHTYGRDEAKETENKMQNFDELKDWRFMFIDKKVYDFMSSYAHKGYGGKGHLDYGNAELLKLIGFTYNGKVETSPMTHDPKRWNHEWEFDGQKFYTDGTWIQYIKGDRQESIYTFDGEYSSLSDAIKIPEDKLWIGEKTMYQLWEYMSPKKQKESLGWIIGKKYSGFDDFEEDFERLFKDNPEMMAKLGDLGKKKSKSLADKYINNVAAFGNGLSQLVVIRSNLHCMSGSFLPYILYLTPQCGEYSQHQVLLEKFVEINKSYCQDEDDE